MKRSIRPVQWLALAAVCLCVFVPPVGAQECLRQMNIPEWQGDEDEGYRYVAVADGYAIATFCDYYAGEGVLRVIDVRTPSEPVEVGSLEMCAGDLVVSGRYAYVDRWDRAASPDEFLDIRVIDVSDPASPTEVALIEGVGQIAALDNGYAYTVSGSSFHVLDVTDPTSASEVGSLALDWWSNEDVLNLAVSGDYAYVVTASTYHGSLHVADVSDPTRPFYVGSAYVDEGSAELVVVSGDHAYIASNRHDPFGGGSLTIVDVSNPEEPIVVEHRSGRPIALAISGHLLYVVTSAPGTTYFEVYDVTDPTEPVWVGSLGDVYIRFGDEAVLGLYTPLDVCLRGRYVYTVDLDVGIVVFDSRDCRYRQMPPAVE